MWEILGQDKANCRKMLPVKLPQTCCIYFCYTLFPPQSVSVSVSPSLFASLSLFMSLCLFPSVSLPWNKSNFITLHYRCYYYLYSSSNLSICLFSCVHVTISIFISSSLLPSSGEEVRYSISGGNTEGLFAIDQRSGAVTLAGALDHETCDKVSLFAST